MDLCLKTQWSYEEAFCRNLGVLDQTEQNILRDSCVAIAGVGGVGGLHAEYLARLGVGYFNLADPDYFTVANINRQAGAFSYTMGNKKTRVTRSQIMGINREATVYCWEEGINSNNIDSFLEKVDVVLDGIDFFEIEVRRLLFMEAHRKGIWVITAAPVGFGTAWLAFSPNGMSFDEYFDIHDGMDSIDMIINFLLGLAPKALHNYFDLKQVNVSKQTGPCVSPGALLASGIATTLAVHTLIGRSYLVKPAPHVSQFDARRQMFRTVKLRWGNRGPIQRIKRWLFKKFVLPTLPGYETILSKS